MKKAMAVAAGLSLVLAGCGADVGNKAGQDVGGIRANLTLPDGTIIETISYSITGPGAIARNGSVDVENGATAQFREGHLPAGAGYNIALAATTSAGVA